MGLFVLVNESSLWVIGALWVLNIYSLENLSSFKDIYFLYRSDMDLEAVKLAVLYILKFGRFHQIKVIANILSK